MTYTRTASFRLFSVHFLTAPALSLPFLLTLPSQVMAARTLADLENIQSTPTPLVIPSRTQTAVISQAEIATIDNDIFNRMMNLAKSSKEPAVINAYIDIANKIKLKNSGTLSEQVLLQSRIDFYTSLLTTINPADMTDDLFYEVASTQDLLGHNKESIAALRQLIARFPQSKYALEAKFRIAEESFSNKNYIEAANFYRNAIAAGNTKFALQAQYGLGWALYKDGRNEDAIEQFEKLLVILKAKPSLSKGENILFNDCYKTIALVFVQMGGAPALAAYYANKPLTADEVLAHENVAKKYIDLKQPFDIAKVYESFISRRPLAPEVVNFSNQLIKVYEDAGYAQDIIRAKTDFINRFDINGAYFEQAPRNTQEQLTKDLRMHTATLAKHYHAVAQQTKTPESYAKPAALYLKLLALLDEGTPQFQETEELLAGTLYNNLQYQAAIPYFEDLAYVRPSKTPTDSAYFVLLCYQALRKNQSGAAYLALLDKEKNSSIAYAKAFPTDKNTYAILDHLTDEYLKLKQYDTLIALSNLQLTLPNLSAEQLKDIYTLLADTHFDNGLFKEAEQAYAKVLTYPMLAPTEKMRIQNQLAATYYKQASAFKASNNKTEASRLYTLASNTSLDVNVKSNAAYQAIDIIGNTPEAIPMLQRFYMQYPTNELSKNILERILNIQEASKDFIGAANTYMQVYARDYQTNNSNALNALWLAAESNGKAANVDYANPNFTLSPAENQLYQKYIAEKNAPIDQQLIAYERLYLDATNQHNMALQQQYLTTHWNLYLANKDKLTGDALLELTRMAARARVTLDAPLIAQYKAIPMQQPLKASIATKMAALQQVIQSQQAILNLKVAQYFTQSQYILGDSYTHFYTAVANAPKPAGLDELALEQYSIVIEEQTQPLKDKAVEWHKLNVDVALKHRAEGLWDQWIGKSFDAMAEISPGKFARPITPPAVLADDTALSQLLVSLKPLPTVIFANSSTNERFTMPLESLVKARLELFQKKKTNIQLAKMLADAAYYQAYNLTSQGKFTEALASLNTSLIANPQFKEAMMLQGAINDLYLDQTQLALGIYQRINALDPDNTSVQKWINIAQKKLGQPLTNFKKPTPAAPVDSTPEGTAVETPNTSETPPVVNTTESTSTAPVPSTAPAAAAESRFAIKSSP